jgi:hypothetical protein
VALVRPGHCERNPNASETLESPAISAKTRVESSSRFSSFIEHDAPRKHYAFVASDSRFALFRIMF